MEEEVEFLSNFVPFTTPDHMQNCVDELSSLTDHLLVQQRFLVLITLLGAKKLPSFFPVKKSEFLAFVSQKPKVSECITAQQMHFICKLFEFFIQNPLKLVTVTVSAFRDYDRARFIFLLVLLFLQFMDFIHVLNIFHLRINTLLR